MAFKTGELTIELHEIHGQGPDRPVAVTASWSAQALQTVAAVISEQLARLRLTPAEDAGQVLLLRQYATLGERFADPAAEGAHAILAFDDTELAVCAGLLDDYVLRVDGDDVGYQPPELRDRLAAVRLVHGRLSEMISEARAAVAIHGSVELRVEQIALDTSRGGHTCNRLYVRTSAATAMSAAPANH